MKISLLIIGDEVLLGQVTDTNASQIAKLLYYEGMKIHKKWTVADQEDEIIVGLQEASQQSDVIIMTGGLGPTKDDITKKALAKFMNQELVLNEKNKQHLISMLEKRNIPLTELHLPQCYLPANAEVLDNQMGTAMGMWMNYQGKNYISTPGVPYEMEFILKNSVIPRLKLIPATEKIIHSTTQTAGIGETEIASIIEPRLGNLPKHISLAYLPSVGQVKIRLTGTHPDLSKTTSEIEYYQSIIDTSLQDRIIGHGKTSIEEVIGNCLRKNKKTVSTAESCTGGLLAHKITSVPGASDYYLGSLIAYHNKMKKQMLGVSDEILQNQGAVSEECVRSMVKGACSFFSTDYAIATSGIAGPAGGTAEKPVGTVWIACGTAYQQISRKFLFTRDRAGNIEASSIYALIEFWKYLKTQ